MDTTCKCGKRFGWQGDLTDMPPCPRCGNRPDAESLANDEAELRRFEDYLLTRKKTREGSRDDA